MPKSQTSTTWLDINRQYQLSNAKFGHRKKKFQMKNTSEISYKYNQQNKLAFLIEKSLDKQSSRRR